jgi:hypothetical protein
MAATTIRAATANDSATRRDILVSSSSVREMFRGQPSFSRRLAVGALDGDERVRQSQR